METYTIKTGKPIKCTERILPTTFGVVDVWFEGAAYGEPISSRLTANVCEVARYWSAEPLRRGDPVVIGLDNYARKAHEGHFDVGRVVSRYNGARPEGPPRSPVG